MRKCQGSLGRSVRAKRNKKGGRLERFKDATVTDMSVLFHNTRVQEVNKIDKIPVFWSLHAEGSWTINEITNLYDKLGGAMNANKAERRAKNA